MRELPTQRAPQSNSTTTDPSAPLIRWCYEGLWGKLTNWFRVPRKAPALPPQARNVTSFRPSPQFLRYLKLMFWILLTIVDGVLLCAWVGISVAEPAVGLAVSPLFFLAILIPSVIAYLALHLRYDTTWYVMSDRSVRIRRGIWVIHETTLTFENVQNVSVHQGPLQRYYGISNLVLETAGGTGGGGEGQAAMGPHVGLIEGITNAQELRDQILAILRRSQTSGLGDERQENAARAWNVGEMQRLREIRDAVVALGGTR